MIKATMVCDNCKEEKTIPHEEIGEAVELEKIGELNFCSDCQTLWSIAVDKMRESRAKEFSNLRKRFGIVS